jgi:carboxypeptidase PM20D1
MGCNPRAWEACSLGLEPSADRFVKHTHWLRPKTAIENLWLTGPLVVRNMAGTRITAPLVRTTTALTMFNAGVKENVVPQRAEARVNFRLLPGDTPETVVAHVREVIDDPLVEISYDRWDGMPPVASTGRGYASYQGGHRERLSEAVVVPSILMATTDTRHYIDLVDDQYRFKGVQVASSQATSIHGTDEYVDVASYENRSRLPAN